MNRIKYMLAWALLLIFTACNGKDKPVEVQGIFEAEEILVSSEANGRVLELSVQEGDKVTQGEELLRIDTISLKYQLDYLETQRENATQNGVVSAQVQTEAIAQQIKALEKEQERVRRLVEKEVLAPAKLDEVNAKLDVAKAQLQAVRQQIEKQNSGSIGTSKALTTQVEGTKEAIDRATVRAPLDGTVLTLYTHQGELTGVGRPLLKIANLNQMTLRIYLSASQLEDVYIGKPVTVYNDMGSDHNNRSYEGKVIWISEKAEFSPKNIQTPSVRSSLIYAAKVSVVNDGYLKIGQYGKAVL